MSIIDDTYQHYFYIHVDADGEPIDGGYVDPMNVFYIMGSTWEVSLEDIREHGLCPVIESNRVFTNGESIIEVSMGDLQNNGDGTFTQLWIEQEITALEKRMRFLERTRDNLLFQSDWTQVADSPMSDELKASWATYRQALRDLPDGIDWDTVTSSADINWPIVPGVSIPDAAITAAANPFLDPE